MTSYTFTLTNEHGLHARPAGLLVQTASPFKSKVQLIKNEQAFNGKSMLGLLKMAGSKGDVITLEIEGEDEHEAIEALKTLIASNFNE